MAHTAPNSALETAVLRSDRFRLEREGDWQRLEAIVLTMENGKARRLSDDDVLALPVLYRTALSSLSIARESSLDAALIGYLENLTLRAYFLVYGTRTSFGRWAASFFAGGWSRAVRGISFDILIAFIVMAVSAWLGYALVDLDPEWYYRLNGASLQEVRVPGASRETLEATLFGGSDEPGLATFAAFLFSNNASVAIMAFALGFALGIPSILLLIYNFVTLGAMVHVFAQRDLQVEFIGWLSIHGTTELLAILLAGAAGMHIGRAIAFPGARSHLEAAKIAGQRGALVMTGAIVMLICAGLLEGFARQLIDSTSVRYAVGYSLLALWIAYFALAGRKQS